MSADLAVIDSIDGEIVDYSADDFETDKATVRRYGEQIRELRVRTAEIERAATIDMARRLHRMRHDPERRWRGPGDKDTDYVFARWAVGEMALSAPYVKNLLSVAQGLAILENRMLKDPIPLPATAGQILRLSAAKVRKLPDADRVIPNLWMAAVEDAGGKQPSQQLVEAIVKRYMRDRGLVDSGALDRQDGADDQTEKVKADLRSIRRKLAKLAALEPALVAAAVAEFYHDYRNVRSR